MSLLMIRSRIVYFLILKYKIYVYIWNYLRTIYVSHVSYIMWMFYVNDSPSMTSRANYNAL